MWDTDHLRAVASTSALTAFYLNTILPAALIPKSLAGADWDRTIVANAGNVAAYADKWALSTPTGRGANAVPSLGTGPWLPA